MFGYLLQFVTAHNIFKLVTFALTWSVHLILTWCDFRSLLVPGPKQARGHIRDDSATPGESTNECQQHTLSFFHSICSFVYEQIHLLGIVTGHCSRCWHCHLDWTWRYVISLYIYSSTLCCGNVGNGIDALAAFKNVFQLVMLEDMYRLCQLSFNLYWRNHIRRHRYCS